MSKLVTVQLKHLRIPARKVRFVADVLRGLHVNDAEARLTLLSRRPGLPLLKLLRSAVQDAKHNFQLAPEKLFIKEIFVDQGPKSGRWMPRARGSASVIEKKTSHVTLVLGETDCVRTPDFTFTPKPKKEDTKKKKQAEAKEAAKEEHAGAKHTNEDTGKQNVARGTQSGTFRKMFRRKSI